MLNVRGIAGKERHLWKFVQERSLSLLGLTETWAPAAPTALRDQFQAHGWVLHDQPAIHGVTRACGGVVLLHDASWSSTKMDCESGGEDVLSVHMSRGETAFVAVVFYNRTAHSRARLEHTLDSLAGQAVLLMGDFNAHLRLHEEGDVVAASSTCADTWLADLVIGHQFHVAVSALGLSEWTWARHGTDGQLTASSVVDYVLFRHPDGLFDGLQQEVVDVAAFMSTDHRAVVFGPLPCASVTALPDKHRLASLPRVVPCYLDTVWRTYRQLLSRRLRPDISLEELTETVVDAYHCVPSFAYAAVLRDLDGSSCFIGSEDQRKAYTSAVVALAEAEDAVTHAKCRSRVVSAVRTLERAHQHGFNQRNASIRWEMQQLWKAEQRKPLYGYMATLVARISTPRKSIPTAYAVLPDGSRVVQPDAVMAVWRAAHAELLGGPQTDFARRPSALHPRWLCTGEQLFRTAMRLRRNKAADFSGLAGEAFINAIPPSRLRPDGWSVDKNRGDLEGPNYWPGKEVFVRLADSFNHVTHSGGIPASWMETTVSFIYKGKGDPGVPANARGIAMIPIMAKLYRTFLAHELRRWAEDQQLLHFAQRSFRERMSVEDNAWMLTALDQVLYKRPRRRRKRKLVLVMVDQRKAYDSVPHDQLFNSLRDKGLDETIVSTLASLYSGTTMRVRLGSRLSDPFPMRRGLAQGAPESPILYNLYINGMLQRLYDKFGCHLQVPRIPAADGRRARGLPALMYADDLLLMGLCTSVCQEMLDWVRDECSKLGLELNLSKTEATILHTDEQHWPAPLTAQDAAGVRHPISWTSQVRYLGLFLDQQLHLKDHLRIMESRMLTKERMLWRAGLLSGERVKTSIVRDYAANQIFAHAEFLATVLPVEIDWKPVQDQQVRIARAILNLPRTSNRAKTMAQVGWVWIPDRLRWFRLKWLLRCRSLPWNDPWHHMMDVICRAPTDSGFAGRIHRDCVAIGKPELASTLDGVQRFIRLFGLGGLPKAITQLKEIWRSTADRRLLHEAQLESNDEARWHSSVVYTPLPVPAHLTRQFSAVKPRVTFMTCHDTLWSRPGDAIRSRMLTDCYFSGERLRRVMACRQGVPLDHFDVRWSLCPFCQSDFAECTVSHLLLECPSAQLTDLRLHTLEAIAALSASTLRVMAQSAHLSTPGLPFIYTVALLTPPVHPVPGVWQEQRRREAWMRIIMGGRTSLPVLTAHYARLWGFAVPQNLAPQLRIVQVDLASNWDDVNWRERRRDMVKLRFDTHVICAQWLMDVDRMYHRAMDEWLL